MKPFAVSHPLTESDSGLPLFWLQLRRSAVLLFVGGAASCGTSHDHAAHHSQSEVKIAPVVAAAAAQAGSSAIPKLVVDAKIDVNDLISFIDSHVKAAADRQGFVTGLRDHLVFDVGHGQFNVMVCNLNQICEYDADLVATTHLHAEVIYAGLTYGVWMFDHGRFILHGDGGYINWGFWGAIERTGDGGKNVLFYPID